MVLNAKEKNSKRLVMALIVLCALASVVIPLRAIVGIIGEIVSGQSAEAAFEPKPLPPEWEATIAELKTFVEEARGLEFKHEFPVILESREDFRNRLASEAEAYDLPDPADSYITLKALGLVEKNLDLNSLDDPMLDGGTVGYYDSFTNHLVVQGTEPTPFVRQILVHELTHALQDQHFNLDRPEIYDSEEAYVSFQALIEGDATRIEYLYLASLSAEEQAQSADEQMGTPGPDAEEGSPSLEVLSMLSSFPYEVGESFVDEVLAAGGQERLDRAFLSPPTSTEQILHPERFLSLDRPKKVKAPKANGKVYEEGVWGQRGLLTLLLTTLPGDQAWEAAEGWGGDSFVAWKKAGKDCVAINIETDTRADRNELVRALRDWSRGHPGASVKDGNTVQISACV